MIETNLFKGSLVRLVAIDAGQVAPLFARWDRNAEFARLLDSDPPRMWSAASIKSWIEEDLEKSSGKAVQFMIHVLRGDRPIGFVDLYFRDWHQGNGWVGIGIGEQRDWGKGYGTDAMRLMLRYAFDELNLHRVSLGVFEFNPRAMRSYEKAGFKVEGRERAALHRDGKRWDIIDMGILRSEWETLQHGNPDT